MLFVQSNAISQIALGPKAMFNIADVGNDSGIGLPRLAAAFGATGEYKVSDVIGIGVDLLYSMQGYQAKHTVWDIDDDGNTFSYSYDEVFKFDYLNLPIYGKFYPLKNHRWYGSVGIQPGIAITRKRVSDDEELDFDQFIESYDLSVPLGIGYRSNMGLAFDMRYNIGVANISKIDEELRSTVIQIGASYFFEL
jgi:hypothetical protein